jgi:hypothetical protein
MAKNQFKVKGKITSLTSRFTVCPLEDMGDEYLCVDANFEFLMVRKAKLEEYHNLALPEVVDPDLHKKAIAAAKDHLPTDTKLIERLRTHLKTKGLEGFNGELEKVRA